LNTCLEYPELQQYASDKDVARRNIIRRKYDSLSVTYEILLNIKLRSKRISLEKAHVELRPTFAKSSSSFMIADHGIENTEHAIYLGESNSVDEKEISPHNWNYCIRTKLEPYNLMCLLFSAFKECELE